MCGTKKNDNQNTCPQATKITYNQCKKIHYKSNKDRRREHKELVYLVRSNRFIPKKRLTPRFTILPRIVTIDYNKITR